MTDKVKIGVLFGGQSVEHQVSLLSAKTVIDALDKNKYEVILIGIDPQGQWGHYEEESYLIEAHDPKNIALSSFSKPIDPFHFLRALDVVFPVLHGALGEDGTVQGLCRLARVPFVGPDVLSSSIGMDKDVIKRLLKEQNIPTARSLTVYENKWSIDSIIEAMPYPFFVKPANGGSSLGIHKVKHREECESALKEAFLYDSKVLIEETIVGREIQLGVIGNDNPIVSRPCEIIPKGEFHSYEAKYIDSSLATFVYPADLEMGIYLRMRSMALKAYQALYCEGMARIDFFLKNSGEMFINEINTIPGLTYMSPFAKMWQTSGLSYPHLLDQLITFAVQAHKRRDKKMFLAHQKVYN